MKKIFLALFMFAAFAFLNPSNAQTHRYYYYPSSNVYYDVSGKHYIYEDNGRWVTVTTLPSTIVVNQPQHVLINSNRPDVWIDNKQHVAKYHNWKWHDKRRHH